MSQKIMKRFKCLSNKGMNHLTVGNIYEGEYSTQHFDATSKPMIEIENCDDSLNGIFSQWRFEEVV